jgi:hypothetical protein
MAEGWGCTCQAFRLTEPTPEQALAALVKVGLVTVTPRSLNQWDAWTTPDSRYIVTRAPGPGGFCKHCLAVRLSLLDDDWLRLALSALPTMPTEIVEHVETGQRHWLRPMSAKTMCGIPLVNGHQWKAADFVTCAKCAKYGRIA